jgi:ElaB/YqjD/DUF883 family membrane-anchored ribosome-binding protein
MAAEKNGTERTSKNSSERPDVKADQLRDDIARTRSALSDDVRALGEKLNPEHLKEEAKEVISHAADVAREGAKHIVHDARDAAFDSLRHAREHAFDSLSDGVEQVSQRARAAGHNVSDFVATHAVPLTLLGAGAGWLLVSMSHQRRLQISERSPQIARRAAYVGHEAAELGRQAYEGIERAGARAVEVSERNPLALGLFALAAGAAAAMLLPPTRRENELLGQTRDRLLESAQRSAAELKHSVQRTASEVREVIDEMRQPGSSSQT